MKLTLSDRLEILFIVALLCVIGSLAHLRHQERETFRQNARALCATLSGAERSKPIQWQDAEGKTVALSTPADICRNPLRQISR